MGPPPQTHGVVDTRRPPRATADPLLGTTAARSADAVLAAPRCRSAGRPLGTRAARAARYPRIVSGIQVARLGKAISTNTISTMIRNIGIAARAM